MSVTILEGLVNARFNFDHIIQRRMPLSVLGPIAYEQLNNAVILLEKGYPLHIKVEPLLEEYGDIDSVPDFEGD